jgi:DNA polymerase elongation subunit (family B)
MSYVDAFFERNKDAIHVVERVNKKRVFRTYPTKYAFFYPDAKGKYRSIYGTPLSRVSTTSGKAFHKEKKLYSHKQLYESDVNPIFRCLEEYYLGKEAPTLNKCFFDIEVDFSSNKGFASPADPFSMINSVTLWCSWLDDLVTLTIRPNTVSRQEAEAICDKFSNTMLCNTEEDLLNNFLAIIQDADILSGWNSEGYDIPYTVNRVARILGKQRMRDFCLWDQYPRKREYEKFGREQETFDLLGRVHLDYMELYRRYTYHEIHSYRLDAVGEYEIGENKVPYEGTLDQLYNNDYEKFIAYNRQDTMMLKKMDDKLQFIDLANVLAHANTVLLPTTMGAVAVSDQAIINEAHSHGLQVPDKKKDFDAEFDTAAGAYVAQPKTGMHDWVCSMDLNSLYPSVIRALNMGPETIIGQLRLDRTYDMVRKKMNNKASFAEAWEGIFNTLEYDLVQERDIAEKITIDWENGDTDQYTGAEIYDVIFLQNNPWAISANGTIFKHDTKGIVPNLLERWYEERKEMQKSLQQAIDVGDKEKIEFWDKRQLVKKINLNSLYGAILNQGSRFFDLRMGQSVTLTGRSIAKHMAAEVNRVLTGEYDHVGSSIIYGDTDSVYYSAIPSLKDDIDNGNIEWDKDRAIKLYDVISDEVNSTFPKYMNKAFGISIEAGQIIKAAREIVATSGLFIKKKRYGILVYDEEGNRKDVNGEPGKLKAMGLDLKRSDTPEFMQRFLEEILFDVLNRKERSDIFTKIKDFREEFKKRPGWEKGTPKRVNNLTKYTKLYDRTGKCGVGHVMAAINWNRLRKAYSDNYSLGIIDGMKTIVCKLKNNPMGMTSIAYPIDELHLPDWYKDLPFDHGEMEKTIINKKISNLIGVLDWDLKDTENTNTFNSLFEIS